MSKEYISDKQHLILSLSFSLSGCKCMQQQKQLSPKAPTETSLSLCLWSKGGFPNKTWPLQHIYLPSVASGTKPYAF